MLVYCSVCCNVGILNEDILPVTIVSEIAVYLSEQSLYDTLHSMILSPGEIVRVL
jgi:hypothetical protein